jgi:hypothetical protein
MAGKNTAVFGIYKSRLDVEQAVDALRANGFRSTDISVLFLENEGTKDFLTRRRRKPQRAWAFQCGFSGRDFNAISASFM